MRQLSPATLSCWLLLFWRGQHSQTSASNTGNPSTPSGSSCSGKPLLEEWFSNSPHHFALQELCSAHLQELWILERRSSTSLAGDGVLSCTAPFTAIILPVCTECWRTPAASHTHSQQLANGASRTWLTQDTAQHWTAPLRPSVVLHSLLLLLSHTSAHPRGSGHSEKLQQCGFAQHWQQTFWFLSLV